MPRMAALHSPPDRAALVRPYRQLGARPTRAAGRLTAVTLAGLIVPSGARSQANGIVMRKGHHPACARTGSRLLARPRRWRTPAAQAPLRSWAVCPGSSMPIRWKWPGRRCGSKVLTPPNRRNPAGRRVATATRAGTTPLRRSGRGSGRTRSPARLKAGTATCGRWGFATPRTART